MLIHSSEFKTRSYILVGTCLLILTIVVTSLATVIFLREREIDSWKHQLSGLSLVLADQTFQSMSSAEIILGSIIDQVNSLEIRNSADLFSKTHSKTFHELLRQKITGLPQVDVATIVAVNGDVINFTRSFPAPKINLSDRDYFKAHLNDPKLGIFISVPVKNKGNGKWIFYITRRLNDSSGRFIGLVLVGISVDYITNFYDRQILPNEIKSTDSISSYGLGNFVLNFF